MAYLHGVQLDVQVRGLNVRSEGQHMFSLGNLAGFKTFEGGVETC